MNGRNTQSDSLNFLRQEDIIHDLLPNIGMATWQTVYCSVKGDLKSFGMGCALLNQDAVERAMSQDGWGIMMSDGRPEFSQTSVDGEEVTRYHRYGYPGDIRPLVRYRAFHGAFPAYVEVDEEFRLYHELAEDRRRGLFFAFDRSGREIEVVRLVGDEVSVRLSHLRQCQAGVGKYLAIYFDSKRFSNIPLSEIQEEERTLQHTGDLVRWRRDIVSLSFPTKFKTMSRLIGKVILAPPPSERAGIWPFEIESAGHVSFIVGVDENGSPVEHTSNPNELTTEQYLTPVFFRRDVLAKYYAEPERYTVSDGRLSCLSIWSCQIDNDLDGHIVVFLGDLGRDLPPEEQLHWKQYNISPEGGISETNFRRSFLAQWTSSQTPDLVFRREYTKLNVSWEGALGWPLYLPPHEEDKYLLNTIRLPTTEAQPEFDQLVGNLAKPLVDSLNEKQIAKQAGTLPKGAKGIDKFEGFLEQRDFQERAMVIQVLRDLQTLRSTGSAHRKGSKYDKALERLGLDRGSKAESLRLLLEKGVVVLQMLTLHFINSQVNE